MAGVAGWVFMDTTQLYSYNGTLDILLRCNEAVGCDSRVDDLRVVGAYSRLEQAGRSHVKRETPEGEEAERCPRIFLTQF